MRTQALVCIVSLGILACSKGAASTPSDTSRSTTAACEPNGWSTNAALTDYLFADINDAMEWPPMTVRESQLLAWSVKTDDRPVVVHNALVWVQAYDEYGTEAWYVLTLARNPGEQWSLMSSDHAHSLGQQFDVLPTGAEIDGFLAESRWQWELEEGWRFVAAQVCAQTWQDVAGAAPSHAYPPAAPTSL